MVHSEKKLVLLELIELKKKNDAFTAAVLKGGTYTRTAFICEYPLNSTELHSRFNL